MKPHLDDYLTVVLIVIITLSIASSDNDLDLNFCGIWHHGEEGSLSLNVNFSTGCNGISISANKNSLSIDGQITSHCRRLDVIPLELPSNISKFCLNWEPLLDQIELQIGGKNYILCWPVSLQGSCCSDLSHGPNQPEANYGILNASIHTDIITQKIHSAYTFGGRPIECTTLCEQALRRSNTSRSYEHICAQRSEVEMKADFKGYNVTSPASKGAPVEATAIVHLPAALKEAAKNTSKVVCTFFNNNHMFQEGHKKVKVLSDVVEITVENEVIANLPDPIRITFHHDAINKTYSRKCVSWDTRKDPLLVNWVVDGCETKQRGEKHTECHCNHLTYFSVLVQLEPQPVRHLLELTVITYLGCAVSGISCVALIIYLCRKRRFKEQSAPIHLGLAASLAFLHLLFFFTGVLANVGGESVCTWVGAGLHYALLSSFSWMGLQVFHTFWLIYKVFSPSPKPFIWMLVGFGLPVVPVVVLSCVGGIYGIREVFSSNDDTNPFLMCWMKNTRKAWLAHYFTNILTWIVLMISGLVMLFMVYRQIKTRDEWRKNRVAFLSIWGLSCLFGTTWGLNILNFGPLSVFVLFISCFLNSFQGFFLMLRFWMLNRMRKQAGGSAFSSSNTGSTRQRMLQAQEKS